MARVLRPLIAVLALSTLTACGPEIRFTDNVDNAFDLRSSLRYDDDLTAPYVAGASFEIYAYDQTEEHDLTGWTVVSRDPEVLLIVDQWVEQDDLDDEDKSDQESDVLVSSVFAAGEGVATLDVYDERGEFVRATEVEVLQPDRIDLRAAGPLFVDDEAIVPSLVDASPMIIADGTATFHVEWFKGEQRLHGSGALGLTSDSPAIVAVWTLETLLDEDRDWATIATAEGIGSPDPVLAPIEVSANGIPVTTLEVTVVGADAVSYVELRGESDAKAHNNDLLVVLAQAFDDDGESIWGVNFDWDLDGQLEPGAGDLFRYWFKRGAWNELGAEYNGVRGVGEIQGEEGFVDTSNDISCFCTAPRDQPARGLLFGVLGLAAIGLVRRRPSRHA